MTSHIVFLIAAAGTAVWVGRGPSRVLTVPSLAGGAIAAALISGSLYGPVAAGVAVVALLAASVFVRSLEGG